MPLQIYNSLTRQKETFETLIPGHVGLYVCGPTVSGESHLGHARPYITFDIVYRYLLHLGYKVRYVRNITDAGHFEEEGREAEDKVASKAQLERLEPMELVHKYTSLFQWGMRLFNNLEPSIEPTATGHIIEQISMIEDIIAKGYAYEVNGSVYFDVKKYASEYPYGKLSGRVIDDLLETTRDLEGQDEKRNKVDFALWKNAPPEHIMRWKSPWGEGFPGWHIECSAMSSKYLGETFDIHGGGMDLLFPHHESEIAQSTIAHGHPPVRYWMHNNMITINGKKMGKSYNNVIKLTELFSGNHPLLEQAYNPMVVRFYILQTHYRSTLDFSNEALKAAEKGFNRLSAAYKALENLQVSSQSSFDVDEWISRCYEPINDDFNTAILIATLFEGASKINEISEGKAQISQSDLKKFQSAWKAFYTDILGLKQEEESGASKEKIEGLMDVILKLRTQAREGKDFKTSDLIRDEVLKLGFEIKDSKEGTKWNVIN